MMGRGLLVESRYYPVRGHGWCGVADRLRGTVLLLVDTWPDAGAQAATLDRGWRTLPLADRERIIAGHGWWMHAEGEGKGAWSQRTRS